MSGMAVPPLRRPSRFTARCWTTTVILLMAVPVAAFAGVHGGTAAVPASDPTLRGGLLHGAAGSALSNPNERPSTDGIAPQFGNTSGWDWPEFHRNGHLTGNVPGSSLTTKNAAKLGVRWATDLYGAALDSPVIAYDPASGKTLAYVGTESGNVLAVDVASGDLVWGTWLGAPIRSTPAVSGGAVYVGTDTNAALFKLNASTGAIECSAISPQPIEGSPTVLAATTGNATVFVGTLDSSTQTGPLLAMNAGNCTIDWTFSAFPRLAGSWDAVASVRNATGVPLVLFGTADPDAAVYAIDAVTGAEVWRFQTYNPAPGAYDVGAGVTISPPGALGFPHGVAYVPNKYGIMYALDLSTGKQIWSVDFNKIAGTTDGGRSTAALEGQNLVFGFSRGLFDLNATTGAVLWQYNDTAKVEVLSSPAILGPSSRAVVGVADLAGGLDVVSLASGKQLYRYQTGGYITASPAVFGGNVIVSSTDGFLYDFAVGGGNDATLPTTAISSPVDGATLPNPNGNVSVAGSAADLHGVGTVLVAVQSGGTTGPWWDSATGSWVPGPMSNLATVNRSTNGTTATWSFFYPAPGAGGTYQLRAYATSTSGQSDIRGAFAGFAVNFSAMGPHLRSTNVYIAPGGSTTVLGGGFGHSENVTIQLAGATLATRSTTVTGYLPAFTLHIPTNAAFGLTSIVGTGLVSGKSATVAIVIANSWDQTGYAPSHLDYEANDAVLDHLITPGNRSWVDLAWHFHAAAAINASPAVVDGVAYIGDAAGELFAVDIHNGGFLWSWTDPTGAPINGSPAVDPSLGRVFVTANDGFVYALSASTGTLVWKVSIGGALTAPVYSGGELYIASVNGTVGAFAETNGSAAWTVSLSGPVRAPPTLDSARDRLFVGETNGDLVALNSTTGAPNWTYVAGGGIFASVTVYGSRVYFGSTDGNITCVLESTGGKVWAYQTGGPVTGAGALSHLGTIGWTSLELLVGSGDGYVYAINASGGSLNYKLKVGSAVVGIAAAEGVVAFEAASGLVGGARTYTNLTVWDYYTAAGLGGAPVILDGTIFVGAEDGYLYAFTAYGQPPV